MHACHIIGAEARRRLMPSNTGRTEENSEQGNVTRRTDERGSSRRELVVKLPHGIAEEISVQLRITAAKEGHLFPLQVHTWQILVNHRVPIGARPLLLRSSVPAAVQLLLSYIKLPSEQPCMTSVRSGQFRQTDLPGGRSHNQSVILYQGAGLDRADVLALVCANLGGDSRGHTLCVPGGPVVRVRVHQRVVTHELGAHISVYQGLWGTYVP